MPPDDPPTTWRFELYGIAYAAGELSEDELFARAGPFHWEKCMADFYVGVQALCEGNVTKARTHLELAANCVAPGWWVTNLSRAYLQLLDTGKLPLPNPDALLNKSAVKAPKGDV